MQPFAYLRDRSRGTSCDCGCRIGCLSPKLILLATLTFDMPIPDFEPSGLLPLGLYDCSFEELKSRFGSFEQTDCRPLLFAKLEAFIVAARAAGFVRTVVVDGSFVTAKPSPNDIDLIIVVAAEHDLRADL